MILPTQRGSTITFNGMAEQEFQVWIETITANVNNYASGAASWGGITGTIDNQVDLINYIGRLNTSSENVSSDTTITEDTRQLNVDASGGDVTITLPAIGVNKFYTIRKVNASGGNVIITGATTINGSSSVTITSQYTSLDIAYCAGEWGIL